jgi:hypothetical protein
LDDDGGAATDLYAADRDAYGLVKSYCVHSFNDSRSQGGSCFSAPPVMLPSTRL